MRGILGEETLDNEDVVENDVEEVVQVLDFEENEGYFWGEDVGEGGHSGE
jgi:hypothetical protein